MDQAVPYTKIFTIDWIFHFIYVKEKTDECGKILEKDNKYIWYISISKFLNYSSLALL